MQVSPGRVASDDLPVEAKVDVADIRGRLGAEDLMAEGGEPVEAGGELSVPEISDNARDPVIGSGVNANLRVGDHVDVCDPRLTRMIVQRLEQRDERTRGNWFQRVILGIESVEQGHVEGDAVGERHGVAGRVEVKDRHLFLDHERGRPPFGNDEGEGLGGVSHPHVHVLNPWMPGHAVGDHERLDIVHRGPGIDTGKRPKCVGVGVRRTVDGDVVHRRVGLPLPPEQPKREHTAPHEGDASESEGELGDFAGAVEVHGETGRRRVRR